MTDKRQMKSAARLYAVQALFQMEASDQTIERVQQEFEDHRFGEIYEGDEMAEGDPELFRKSTASTPPCARCSAPPVPN